MATRVGTRLKAVREQLGYSRMSVAKQAGIDAAMLFRIENSPKSDPTFETIRKLAAVLEISLDWLAGSSRLPTVGKARVAEVQRIQKIERARAVLQRVVDQLSDDAALPKRKRPRKKT